MMKIFFLILLKIFIYAFYHEKKFTVHFYVLLYKLTLGAYEVDYTMPPF